MGDNVNGANRWACLKQEKKTPLVSLRRQETAIQFLQKFDNAAANAATKRAPDCRAHLVFPYFHSPQRFGQDRGWVYENVHSEVLGGTSSLRSIFRHAWL